MINSSTAHAMRLWLYALALLIAAMVMIGGATRLTESGLSITEWQPVAGIVPPVGESQWQAEFDKYKQTTQYRELNSDMSLAAFKKIYWWEWVHRFLGRLIGLAFALPFAFFAFTKHLPRPLLLRLSGILLLGGLQGAVGWWMVVSGLAGRIDVAPYRLAIHLTLALVIFAMILMAAFSLNSEASERKSKNTEQILLALIFLQIFLGGLVAGTRAGYVYNTWPLMDGGIVPSGLLVMKPWWRNLFENTAMVQFLHRMNAYLILLAGFAVALTQRSKISLAVALMLAAQVVFGIMTLLSGMDIVLALAHQAGAIVVLTLAVRLLCAAPDPGLR